ncbi:hypothetical protein FGE12_25550 [Aggregicoccus sp. 17bor-14]|nr:hypothetical protein [Simulacricoccus sp. 17bor-14]MRI91534.1 hypothetical protein [Aggregicoccus sp. 17bor-14]
MKNPESLLHECEELEAELAALKAAYEQYFLGAERHPPLRTHEALKKRVNKLQTGFVRNTAMKFRVQSLQAKFLTYERLWARTMQEIESGTYKRDLIKARRRAAVRESNPRPPAQTDAPRAPVELEDDSDFDVDQALAALEAPMAPLPQPVAPLAPPAARPSTSPLAAAAASSAVSVPPAPAIPSTTRPGTGSAPPGLRAPAAAASPPLPSTPTPPPMRAVALGPPLSPASPGVAAPRAPAPAAARPAAPASAGGSAPGISDDKLRAVYDAYVTAKRRCQEDTSKLSFESVAGTLRRQVPELMRQHNAKAVEFKVVIKDGKAVLKAVPK